MSASDLSFPTARASHWQALTAAAAALTILCICWAFADTRTVDGSANWLKPLKFSASFVVLFGTIALLENRLSAPVRQGLTLRIVAFVMGVAFVAEMGWIIRQAAVGRASHFNFDTQFEALMYGIVMAFGAVSLVVCTAVIGWVAKRDTDARLGTATREAIWLGFVLSCVLTLVVAFPMSNMGRHVGIHPEGGATLPLVGWSGVVGDFRPAHFLSLHAMQVLPLLGLLRDRVAAQGGVAPIRLAAALYAALTLAVFAQALAGLPLISLG